MAEQGIREDVVGYPAAGIGDLIKRVSWGAVWAGVMVAFGMEVLFTLFGLFIGFGMYDWRAANPWAGISTWSTIWYLVTAGWSMFSGAWCAARLSSNPMTGDEILHGITTWGLATAATVAIAAIMSWAVLREGVNVLSTAAIAAEQVAVHPAAAQIPPGQVAQAAQQAAQAAAQAQANAGPIAQATANIISGLCLRIFGGVILGFITAFIGGWLRRSRPVLIAPQEVVPVPVHRAA